MSKKGQIFILEEIQERFGIHLGDALTSKIQDIFFLVYFKICLFKK